MDYQCKISRAEARKLEYANAPLLGNSRKKRRFVVSLFMGHYEIEDCIRAAKAAGGISVAAWCCDAIKSALAESATRIQYWEHQQELARARKAGFKV